MTLTFLQSDADLRAFIHSWETHALPKAEWTHAAHVAVCAFYTAEAGPQAAAHRMQQGIPLYNLAVGGQNTADAGYHETLTQLWALIVRQHLAAKSFPNTLEAVKDTVACFGEDRKRHELYYTFDVLNNRQARREWVPPDREPG